MVGTVVHEEWPELGRVGICRATPCAGQHVFLITDRPWYLYLEPPWENYELGESRFSYDMPIMWERDAQVITDDWEILWLDPGPDEEALEREVFGERAAYLRAQTRLRHQHRPGRPRWACRWRGVWPSSLTWDEWQIAQRMARDEGEDAIAEATRLELSTVRRYVERVHAKLGTSTSKQVAEVLTGKRGVER